MKKNYEKYIIPIFLLLGPFLDVASFLGTSLSILVRGIFLLSILFILFWKRKNVKILFVLMLYSIISFFFQYFYCHVGIVATFSSIFKFLYLPVTLLYFQNYEWKVEKKKIFSIILATYLGIYLFSYLLGIGQDVYLEAEGKSGFKGLFSSINEFSAIVVCLLPIVTTYLRKQKKIFLAILFLLMAFLSSLLIGTKVLMGGVIFSVFYLLWQDRELLFFKRKKIEKLGILFLGVLILCSGIFFFTKTRTYQNMIVQQKFFEVKNVFSFDFVNRVIYNDRLTFLTENLDYYRTRSVGEKILGIGMQNFDVKMVEIDIFDLFFRYGILGFLVFFGCIFPSLSWKKLETSSKISFLLLFLVSCTSGHVLIYPAVSIFFSLL